VHDINAIMSTFAGFGFHPTDLVPPASVAGREAVPRLILESGDSRKPLVTLRELVSELRRLGEKGMTITRFKGLGEMDPEELWDTTLDPEHRTLMQVKLDDAAAADEMFRTLMGEKVEPRRDFINKHALLMEEIDYHGA
jgi:DNA gyrase subunit B